MRDGDQVTGMGVGDFKESSGFLFRVKADRGCLQLWGRWLLLPH